MTDRPESDILFQIDLDRFVSERNTLARRLRSGGQREEAARVAKLRRPAATVWALNQVARSEPARIESMLEAGSKLRAALERALSGDATDVRAARAVETRAVDGVVTAASERLVAAGHLGTDAARQRMAATLRAAIVDQAVALQLHSGTLDVDREAPGFGLDSLSFAAAGMPISASEDRGDGGQELQHHRARQDDLMAEAERLAGEAERLEADASHAERRASDARASADQAESDARSARVRADQAASDAMAARDRAEKMAEAPE